MQKHVQDTQHLPAAQEKRGRLESSILRQLKKDKLALVGLGVVIVIIVIALLAPFLPIPNPNATSLGKRLRPPLTEGFLLGSDHLGRDLLSRLVWGARISLIVGAVSALLAMSVGGLLGLISGYIGGASDHLIMRAIDMLMAFPYVLLAIALVAALGPGLFNAMVAIAIVNISFYARGVRSAVLILREQDFIEASRAEGATHVWIIFRHILPNIIPSLIVFGSMNVGWMITETAGLSFIGLGAQPPTADWGTMLADGRQFITVAYHVATIPGLAILVLVLGLNLVGDCLRDALDPRLRT
jgi:peptide/nickel transport system permease protein